MGNGVIEENVILLYTDGSLFPHPHRGGIGFLVAQVDNIGEEIIIYESDETGYTKTSINRMEITACIKGLEYIIDCKCYEGFRKVIVKTDSLYLKDNINNLKYIWPKKHWLNASGGPVKNPDLWKELLNIIKKVPFKLEFSWVKGHAKDGKNKRVDKIARTSAKNEITYADKIIEVRKKLPNGIYAPGCVEMKGQRISIRIVTSELLREQKVYKYKYQVLTKDDKHYNYIDDLCSCHCLSAGHHYEVELNTIQKNPRIEKVIAELER